MDDRNRCEARIRGHRWLWCDRSPVGFRHDRRGVAASSPATTHQQGRAQQSCNRTSPAPLGACFLHAHSLFVSDRGGCYRAATELYVPRTRDTFLYSAVNLHSHLLRQRPQGVAICPSNKGHTTLPQTSSIAVSSGPTMNAASSDLSPNLSPSSEPPLIRVAIVEDDEVFRAGFEAAIASAADLCVSAVARTCAEGLAMLQGPAAHVLLVDLGLPDGSGIDVIQAAQMHWPECATMVATVFGDEAHVLASIEAGASGYLLKDATAEGLVAEVRTVHAGGSPISPLIARRVLQCMRVAPAGPSPSPPPAEAVASTGPAEVSLSARETRVLELAVKGFTYEEIAGLMNVSRYTVQTFVRRIYQKLKVGTKLDAVQQARLRGWLPPGP